MELLFGDEGVWSAILEYWLKRGINFDPIIGSWSNVYRGFQRLFLYGKVWNRYSMVRKFGRPALSVSQKGHNFLSDHLIKLKFLEFSEVVFHG